MMWYESFTVFWLWISILLIIANFWSMQEDPAVINPGLALALLISMFFTFACYWNW